MKRRDFLKILGITPAIAAVPALAKTDKETNWEYVAEARDALNDALVQDIFIEGSKEPIKLMKYDPSMGNIYHAKHATYELGDIVIINGEKYRSVITR